MFIYWKIIRDYSHGVFIGVNTNMKTKTLREIGLSRKQFDLLDTKCKYDLACGQVSFSDQSLFCYEYTKIPRLDLAFKNSQYSFLHTLRAPVGFSYVYFVYNKKTGVVKLGKSRNIWARILNHVGAFVSYGNAELKDLGCIFSRNAFSDDLDIECLFLDYYNQSFPSASKIKREYFVVKDSRETIKKVIQFFNKINAL